MRQMLKFQNFKKHINCPDFDYFEHRKPPMFKQI